MRVKVIGLIMLFCLVVSFPVGAIVATDIADYRTSPMAVAWKEDDAVYVAIVNESTTRQSFAMEIYDSQRRTVLDSKEIIIPGKAILIETLKPRRSMGSRFTVEEVTIYKGYQGKTIKIQDSKIFAVENYIVPAATILEMEVDLKNIYDLEARGRLTIDSEYSLTNTRIGGQITVKYDPGLSYIHRNILEYRPPFLLVSMRLPYFRDVGILYFGFSNWPEGAWHSEYTYGPAIIVYGSDYDVLDNTKRKVSDPTSDWVTR